MPWKPAYQTLAEVKAYLRITDAVDDTDITLAAEAASRAIDWATNRQFGQVAAVEARVYEPVRPTTHSLSYISMDDLQDVTGVLVHYSNVDYPPVYNQLVGEYTLWPYNAADEGRPYTRLVNFEELPKIGRIQVTAKWGWTAVPTTIKQATLLQASRLFNRRNAPFGVAGSPDAGSELRLLERLDPDVAVMVQPFKRHWGAA